MYSKMGDFFKITLVYFNMLNHHICIQLQTNQNPLKSYDSLRFYSEQKGVKG